MLQLNALRNGVARTTLRGRSRVQRAALSTVPVVTRRPTSAVAWTLLLAGAGAAAADVVYPAYVEEENKTRAATAIGAGGSPLMADGDELSTLPRESFKKQLQSLLTAKASRGGSSVIIGERGTGKTSIVKHTVAETGEGVLYIDGFKGLKKAVDDALNAQPVYESILRAVRSRILRWAKADLPSGPATPDFVHAWETLEEAAGAQWQATRKPTVVVVDNVDELAVKEPEAFKYLQTAAAADDTRYRLVLVVSDSSVLRDIQAGPSWTRASRTIEVGDLSKAETLEYLQTVRGLPKADAYRIGGLIGGRIGDLALAADRYQEGAGIEEIESEVWSSVVADFEQLESLSTTAKGIQVAQPLLTGLLRSADGMLPLVDVAALINSTGGTKEGINTAEGLVKASRVLSLDPSGRYVRFMSPLSCTFAQAKYGHIAHRGGARVAATPPPPPAPLLPPPEPKSSTAIVERKRGSHAVGVLKALVGSVICGVVALGGLGASRNEALLKDLFATTDVQALGPLLYTAVEEGAQFVAALAKEGIRVAFDKFEELNRRNQQPAEPRD